jgi:hypothetical protein
MITVSPLIDQNLRGLLLPGGLTGLVGWGYTRIQIEPRDGKAFHSGRRHEMSAPAIKVKIVEYGEDIRIIPVQYGETMKVKIVEFGEQQKAKVVKY